MLVALEPIRSAVGIRRINVATYQAVSGSGKKGIEELAGQTARLLNAQPIESSVYPQQIAFNALPAIGDLEENGYTNEEMKMVWETEDFRRRFHSSESHLRQNSSFLRTWEKRFMSKRETQ